MGVGKVPDETEAGLQASLEGNHDHPESGTHRAPSHWRTSEVQILIKKSIQRGGRVGGNKQL